MSTCSTAEPPESTLVRPATAKERGFFERNCDLPPEVIEGILREKQIAVLGGDYGVGKSPFLADLTICALYGLEWCGRKISQRSVIAIDFESGGPMYRNNLLNIAQRRGVELPRVPEDLDIYLYNDDASERATKVLHAHMIKFGEARLSFLREALQRQPNALVLIDPVDLLFPAANKLKSEDIVEQYGLLRNLFIAFPQAAFLLTRNLRKKDRRDKHAPNLLRDPRGWLENISGSLDILNRSDVRIGIDLFKANTVSDVGADNPEGIRVVNGIRRGEALEPLLIQPAPRIDDSGKIMLTAEGKIALAGFELADVSIGLGTVLTDTQLGQWQKLPAEFHFEEFADKIVPRASLSRLLEKAKGAGAVRSENGVWRKRQPEAKK